MVSIISIHWFYISSTNEYINNNRNKFVKDIWCLEHDYLPISKYTPTLVIIMSKKSGSSGPTLNVQLKMQPGNDYSNFFYLTLWFLISICFWMILLCRRADNYTESWGTGAGEVDEILWSEGDFWSKITKYLETGSTPTRALIP